MAGKNSCSPKITMLSYHAVGCVFVSACISVYVGGGGSAGKESEGRDRQTDTETL